MAAWLGKFKEAPAEVPAPMPDWALGKAEPDWEDWEHMSSPAAGLYT